MCDYSLHAVKSRPAAVGDKLVTFSFNYSTRGFTPVDDEGTAVCCLPGTELSFADDISCGLGNDEQRVVPHRTAVFRQINVDQPIMHHDAIELPDGEVMLLTLLRTRQHVTVLQLPAKPIEVKEQAQEPVAAPYEDLVLLG